MITANNIRQSIEGGWRDPPPYLSTYRNYRESLKLQRESCRAGGFVGSYRAVRSVIRCTARNPAFKNSVVRSCDRPLLATFRRYTQTEENNFMFQVAAVHHYCKSLLLSD
jgi:hypothetical protein